MKGRVDHHHIFHTLIRLDWILDGSGHRYLAKKMRSGKYGDHYVLGDGLLFYERPSVISTFDMVWGLV